jgi:RNA polymerase sigma-70 factor (ECF subfamily)
MKIYNDKSDDQLISLYVDGTNEAFDELLERHKDRIYMYIYHAVKNEELADDIFQDTFVKAITTIKQGRYVENGHFPAWITRIAHNLIIDYFRQTKTENLQSTDDDEVNILNRKELADGTVEDNLVATQIHNDVRRLIRALPASQREVLVMRYYKNMSFKEIADTTGVSINTALGRMRYAILNMRRLAEENNIVLTM